MQEGNILKDGQFLFITTLLLWIAALSAEDFYVLFF